MSDLIVEVNVENGLPATEWRIKDDPRYLLAVVHELKEYQKRNDVQTTTVSGKFVARWMNETNRVQLEIPFVDGDYKMFLFVLTQTLESMAKIKIEIEWGRKFLGAMMAQPKIAVPNPPGGQLAL